MKALTIKQPWSTLIVDGIKDIENRTWKTNYRGRILIHASEKEDLYWFDKCNESQYKNIQNYISSVYTKDEYRSTFGSIIGSVEITDCVINHPSIWAEKTHYEQTNESNPDLEDTTIIYNWVLANPVKFDKPIPMKGKLRLWNVDLEDDIELEY